MRTLIIILLVLAAAQLGFGQTCDTIDGRTVNCIDENGLRQGDWEYWKYEWRQKEYTGEVAGYCQTKPLTKVPIKLLKKGKYKDDKKVGKWAFIDDGGDYISTTRTEQYLDDGSVEVEESGFQSVYNLDSSIVKSVVLSGKDTIYINCKQKQCIGTYKSQHLVSTPLAELETEIDKIRWGSYAREIKILKFKDEGAGTTESSLTKSKGCGTAEELNETPYDLLLLVNSLDELTIVDTTLRIGNNPAYLMFKRVSKQLTSVEMFWLLQHHENPVIRGYSYLGLKLRHDESSFYDKAFLSSYLPFTICVYDLCMVNMKAEDMVSYLKPKINRIKNVEKLNNNKLLDPEEERVIEEEKKIKKEQKKNN